MVRADAGAAVVALWGREVTVPAEEPAAAGQTVSLVLRPESVALLPEGAAAPAAEVAGAVVQAVSYDPLRHGLFDVGARVQVACAPASLRVLRA